MIASLNVGSGMRWGLGLVTLLGVTVTLRLGETIFIPTVIAVLLAGMVYPWVFWLHKKLHFSWTFSCLLVVFLLVVLNLIVSLGFILAVPRMLQGMPNLRDDVGQQDLYRIVRDRLAEVMPLDEEFFPMDHTKSKVFSYIQQTLNEGTFVTRLLWSVAYYANTWLWQWVLIMFILIFLLMEAPMLSRRVVEIFGPSPEAQLKAVETLAEMANAIRTYLVWRTIVNFGLAIVVGSVYQWVFHLKHPWVWALLTAVACYVPYLGPIVAGIPPIMDAFVTGATPWHAVGVLLFYLAIITVEGYVLVPVVMGRSMELNATTVMLACLFWDLVWGLPGLFLAMPLMAAIRAICEHVPEWRPWANLMSTHEEEPASKKSEVSDQPALSEETLRLTPEEAAAIDLNASKAKKES